MSTNIDKFETSKQKLLAEILGTKAPSIDENDPHWSEIMDVKDYLMILAKAVDEHILEIATLTAARSHINGIDLRLAEGTVLAGLDGNLFYDLEEEAKAVRSAATYRDPYAQHRLTASDLGLQRAA